MKDTSFILTELKRHAPFTAFGAVTGLIFMAVIIIAHLLDTVIQVSSRLFFVLHPFHVFLSALVTTGIFKLYTFRIRSLQIFLIGYIGAVGIATVSDCLIPFLSESLIGLPNRGLHIGVVEKPILTNFAAFLGILTAAIKPSTKFPHFGHVLISTWASMFHIIMAMGTVLSLGTIIVVAVFLFIAVWLPCCLSDIVFPLLFVAHKGKGNGINSPYENKR